jgi:ATP-dependent exoDNAse (exonuclease V) beta subunit
VLTEQDVVDAEGRLFRMDRILVDPHEVTVLDYKTGGDSDAYDAQVRNYMELLRQLYPGRPVRGILAFIDRNRVREVV